jgi:hypothetical protein
MFGFIVGDYPGILLMIDGRGSLRDLEEFGADHLTLKVSKLSSPLVKPLFMKAGSVKSMRRFRQIGVWERTAGLIY